MMAGKSGVPRKEGALVLSRHTLWKIVVNTGLEHEGRRRCKSGQYRGDGIEDRPSADIPADAAVDHRLPRGRAAQHGNQPAARLKLTGERVRRDFGCPVDEN